MFLCFKNVYIMTFVMTWIRKSIDNHLHFKMVFLFNFNTLILLNLKKYCGFIRIDSGSIFMDPMSTFLSHKKKSTTSHETQSFHKHLHKNSHN